MDFTLREWLIIVGVIVILFVLLDGYRRVRSGNRGRLKMSIDKNQKFSDDERMDYFNGELPNGGARVVTHAGENEDVAQDQSATQGNEEPPVPAFDVDPDLRPDPLFADDLGRDPEIAEVKAATENFDEVAVSAAEPEPEVEQEPVAEPDTSVQAETPVTQEKSQQNFQEVEEVIVMNVFAKDDKGFNGSELMRVILACGMRYGEMDIFHRTENQNDGPVQFSMANLVKPGTFNLDEMDEFYTPGVSFFLSLPGPKNSMKAFDYMHETAQCLVKNLNGELKDEIHSVMTGQTIEHSRQKIRDFERRQLSLLR